MFSIHPAILFERSFSGLNSIILAESVGDYYSRSQMTFAGLGFLLETLPAEARNETRKILLG